MTKTHSKEELLDKIVQLQERIRNTKSETEQSHLRKRVLEMEQEYDELCRNEELFDESEDSLYRERNMEIDD